MNGDKLSISRGAYRIGNVGLRTHEHPFDEIVCLREIIYDEIGALGLERFS